MSNSTLGDNLLYVPSYSLGKIKKHLELYMKRKKNLTS